MADDWRVTIRLQRSPKAKDALAEVPEHKMLDELHERLGGCVAISSAGDCIFLYADTAEVAHEARRIAQAATALHEVQASVSVDCWDELDGTWRDAEAWRPPGPEKVLAHSAEKERAFSQDTGVALWQVRVHLRSRRDAAALADQLTEAGIYVVRHRKSVIAGADSESDARDLEATIGEYATPSASISVERTAGGIGITSAPTWAPPPPM